MRIANRNIVVMNFLPHENKALEEYLELMSLKGWKLKNIVGIFLIFVKYNGNGLKYSVDLIDKITYFDGENSEISLEYREYCEKTGWKFICEKEKMHIYFTEKENESIVEIHTDEKEKFNIIIKSALKYFLLILFTIASIGYSQYINLFSMDSVSFLADNIALITIILLCVLVIHNIYELFIFIKWYIKEKKKIVLNEKIEYIKYRKFKFSFYKIEFLITILCLIYIIIEGGRISINLIGILLIISIGITLSRKFISKSNIKNKKNMNIIIYSIGCFLIVFAIPISMLSSTKDINVIIDKNKLSLEDFNDKKREQDPYEFINSSKSILASEYYYSVDGENTILNYKLFESKYESLIKYAFNRKMEYLNNIEYRPSCNKIYMDNFIEIYSRDEGEDYYMISKNKFLEISNYDKKIDDKILLEKAYRKIFERDFLVENS